MFREMRRKSQALAPELCRAVLDRNTHGVLALTGDGGYPYAVPLSYLYEDGRIYFHCAKEGHKIDAVRGCDKASFCVIAQGERKEGDWALTFRSVIVFGRIREVEDPDVILRVCRDLSYKFTSDDEYIEHEIATSGKRVLVHELTIEHITGKTIREA